MCAFAVQDMKGHSGCALKALDPSHTPIGDTLKSIEPLYDTTCSSRLGIVGLQSCALVLTCRI